MQLTLKFNPPYEIGNGKALTEVYGEMGWFSFVRTTLSMLVSALMGIIILDVRHQIVLRLK
jgi:hypothetical protein